MADETYKKLDNDSIEETSKRIILKIDLLQERAGYQQELERHQRIVANMQEKIAKVNEKLQILD